MKVETILINKRAKLVSYFLDNDAELYVKARPCILVYPGGGYAFTSKREAEQVALSFNNAGFNALVCYYTCQLGFDEAYKDGSEAFRYVYEHKKEFAINKLLVCGFSAGAHLACCVSARMEIKPDGMILIYPPLEKEAWTDMCPSAPDAFSLIDAKTPKAFIVHACDDPLVKVRNSYRLMQKLDELGVEFEAHVYRKGGHGFSLASKPIGQGDPSFENDRKSSWFPLCLSWIKEGIGDIEFHEKCKLSVDDLPPVLKTKFSDFYSNKKAMQIIEESFHGLYIENKGKSTEGFPLGGVIIYTRLVGQKDLEELAKKLEKAL